MPCFSAAPCACVTSLQVPVCSDTREPARLHACPPLSVASCHRILVNATVCRFWALPGPRVCCCVEVCLAIAIGHGCESRPARAATPALTTKGFDHKTPIRTSFDQRFNRYSQLSLPQSELPHETTTSRHNNNIQARHNNNIQARHNDNIQARYTREHFRAPAPHILLYAISYTSSVACGLLGAPLPCARLFPI